jgi:hypothetical protein
MAAVEAHIKFQGIVQLVEQMYSGLVNFQTVLSERERELALECFRTKAGQDKAAVKTARAIAAALSGK